MMHQGKLVILFIFGLSVLMGGYAWWHNYQQGRRCLALWGSETASRIRYAPRVEVLQLQEQTSPRGPSVLSPSGPLQIVASRDITSIPGLVHARQALIEDASYVWDHPGSREPADWTYALCFSDSTGRATLLFEGTGERVYHVEGQRQAWLLPARMAAFRQRLPQWLSPT